MFARGRHEPFGNNALVLRGHVLRDIMIDIVIQKLEKLFLVAYLLGNAYLLRDHLDRKSVV